MMLVYVFYREFVAGACLRFVGFHRYTSPSTWCPTGSDLSKTCSCRTYFCPLIGLISDPHRVLVDCSNADFSDIPEGW
jgi:hypothetical protein